MNHLRLILAALTFLAVTALPQAAFADVNEFSVTSFSADETLSRADLQGEMRIKERINVDFTDYNHGIERAIPLTYKDHSISVRVNGVSSDSGAPSQYTTYKSNGNIVLRIGDPDSTVTGPQEYNIDYTVSNVITFYDNHDELYWDVNGDQWRQPFEHVTVRLHLPPGLRQNRSPVCFTGSYGGTAQNCTVSNQGSTIEITNNEPLAALETLTYVAGFDKGYFQPASWREKASDNLGPLVKVLTPIIILGGGSWLLWLRRGRDAKGTGVIVPQYGPPDDLRPIEVGTIMDFKVDNKDITATLIDLAVRGYIQIIETKDKKVLRKDKLHYTLKLLNPDLNALTPIEKKLMDGIFKNAKADNTVDLSKLKTKLYTAAQEARTSTEADLTKRGYFSRNPVDSASMLTGTVITVLIVTYVLGGLLGGFVVVGLIIGAILAGIFSRFMGARTARGVAAKEHIEGLKMYLETAEKDRIAKLQSPDAAYAANAADPVKTVELFEKLLPYAMVLGVEKQWAGQFESLYLTPPEWYNGNWSTFNAAYLAASLNDGIGSSVNAAFSAPSSSGGSGFGGGGGFSGGGGGGGGGGGW